MDGTLISVLSSTKKKDGKSDPDMHQIKKGNQCYIGLKAHVGMDKGSGLIYTDDTTAANVYDSLPPESPKEHSTITALIFENH